MDKNFVHLGCNDNVLNMLGMTRDKYVGTTYEDLVEMGCLTQEQAASFKSDDLIVMSTGTPKLNIEEPPVVHSDGRILNFLTTRVPIKNKAGEIIGAAGISIDISDKKHNELLREGKIKSLQISGAAIAHELRSPLAAISVAVSTVGELLPIFIRGYNLAKEANLPVGDIHPIQYKCLVEAPEDIESIINQANVVINMQLMNTKNTEIDMNSAEILSISDTVNCALKKYPHNTKNFSQLVHFDDKKQDFKFKGFEEITMYMIFNLFKNAVTPQLAKINA